MSKRKPHTWLLLNGQSLAAIEEAAIRQSFIRNLGNQTRMRAELKISKSGLRRKLAKLGLLRSAKPRHLQDSDIARAFNKHRAAIVEELKIHDSTLMRWLESRLPALLGGSR